MSSAAVLHPMDAGPARRAPALFTHVLGLADPSDNGAVAVAHAGLLARASGADLVVFHASEIRELGYDPPDTRLARDVRSAAERLARAALESLAQTTGVPRARRRVVVERAPAVAATMADVALRVHADVVVMAPHDRGRLAGILATSVTRATIERLHDRVPVLCARGEARPYRRILVPTDFTPRSRAALRLAARLGARFGSEVTVLHAIGSGEDEESARAALARFIPRDLAGLAPRLAVERGEPGAAIVSAAERTAADLVVVSTGAERVIRKAPCPVLVA